MRKLLTIFLLLASVNLSAAYYYVKNGGNDSANGLSDATAWATLNKVNTTSLSAGDKVFFKRGDTWEEILQPSTSGTLSNRITFGAYDDGYDPIITAKGDVPGWSSSGNWTSQGSNRYSIGCSSIDRIRIWLNGVEAKRAQTTATVNSTTKWYFASNVLWVYSTTNPASGYTSIEKSGVRNYALYISGKNYLTFENIDFQSGNYNCVYITGSDFITFDGCSIGNGTPAYGLNATNSDYGEVSSCLIDAGDRLMDAWQAQNSEDGIHLGNNVTYWDIHDNIFQDWGHDCIRVSAYNAGSVNSFNKIHDNYFSASNVDYCRGIDINAIAGGSQGNEVYNNYFYDFSEQNQLNCPGLKFYNNIINTIRITPYRSGSNQQVGIGIEVYDEDFDADGMMIYNNTIMNCAYGGLRMIYYGEETDEIIENNVIANNIFYNNGASNSYYQITVYNSSTKIIDNEFKYNLFYYSGQTARISYRGSNLTVAQFNTADSYGDVISNNIVGDPVFESTTDFHIGLTSAAKGAGTTVISYYDYDGEIWATPPSIGAYEYVSGYIPPDPPQPVNKGLIRIGPVLGSYNGQLVIIE